MAYSIQYVPQVLHNINHRQGLFNISVFSQFAIFVSVLCDMVITIGCGYEWQYAAIAIFYLLGVCIQQLQITFLSTKVPELTNLLFILCFAVAMLAMGSNSQIVYKVAQYIGFTISIFFWVPQIYKNHKQKRADGYSLAFILIALTGTSLYLLSCIFFSWDRIYKINAIAIFPAILILLTQKIYYRNYLKTE
ncbi:PQ-loop repeat-containing protein [Francisella sp. 19S2-10]|nr:MULTISPECIES: PQ-loop repeat-containing protein [unclassified Francisella]MED7818702.1 PQ-loop repeat-containing protein [Francisella sp. 19S2-4]MED7829581.1 PQ-loop repeat-containing protein [Francisella sp. 19S2-10]